MFNWLNQLHRWRPGRYWAPRRDPYYELVGMVTVSWAFIETGLDLANEVILHYAGGDEIQKSLPISLKPKILFYSKAHEQLPALINFRDEGTAIAAELLTQKEYRHDLVHSVMETKADSIGTRELVRHIYDGNRTSNKVTIYSHKRGWEISQEALRLSRRAANHNGTLIRTLIQNYRQQQDPPPPVTPQAAGQEVEPSHPGMTQRR